MHVKSRFWTVCFLGSAAVFLGWAATTSASQPAQPGAKEKPYTVTYDVSDIVVKRSFWDLSAKLMDISEADKKPLPVMDGMARTILDSLADFYPEQARLFLGKQATYSIQLLNGNKLEIHADKKTHEFVKDLLQTFRSLLDLAVIAECYLFEVDRKLYDEQIAGKLNRHPGSPAIFVDPATEEFEMKFLEGKVKIGKPFYAGLKPLKKSKVTIQDREQGEIFSWRTAVPYETIPGGKLFVQKGEKEMAVAYPGFSFTLAPVVSADRRIVQVKLTQKVTHLEGWQKLTALEQLPNQDTKKVAFDVPLLRESTFTSNFTALDGWPIVAEVVWQNPAAKGKDKVLVLVFSARILIEEEEKLIQQGQLPKKDKK